MPAEFDNLGIRFQYPDNWTLDDADALAGRQSVTVYSPGGAFWSVAIHSRSASPARLVQTAVQAMQDEYQGMEVVEVRETIDGHEMIGYDLCFYYLDLTNMAQVRCLRTNGITYLIFCQGEDREFERVLPVFRAITASLLKRPSP